MDHDFEIPLRTRPLRVKVGDAVYEFQPELDSEQMLDAHEKLQAVRAELRIDDDGVGLDADVMRRMIRATREYVARLMMPDSAQEFLADPPPDRVVMEMSRWAMEQHGGRPTGPSTGSSGSSPATASRSTAASRSKGSTGGAGARKR